MKTEIITITPETAARLLEVNQDNRNLRPSVVANYANLMRRGEWHTTPQGIILAGTIADPIRLLDGQHRLAAICVSQKTIRMTVTAECPESLVTCLDSGATRSYGDRLGLSKNHTSLITAVYYVARCGRLKSQLKPSVEQLEAIWTMSGPTYSRFTNTAKRGLTSAGIKAGFALCYGQRGPELYQSFIQGETQKLTTCLNRLCFRLATGRLSVANKNLSLYDLCAAEVYCLIYASQNPESNRILVPENFRERVKEFMDANFPEFVAICNG